MTDKKASSISKFQRVCVFCGSSSGNKECYKEAAIEVGKELVARNLDLIYGGGSIGLMGLVSKVVRAGGRNVTGIIPKTMIGREKTGETVGELIPVTTMHERKAEMARLSDCFIALPGGFGTLEELLEVITWAQLGIHNKPVGLLNVDGYYDLLLRFTDKAVEEGFIKGEQRNLFVSAANAKELVQKMEEYVPEEGVAKYMKEWEEDQQKQRSPAVGLKVLLADIIQPASEFKVCRRRFNVVNHRLFCY